MGEGGKGGEGEGKKEGGIERRRGFPSLLYFGEIFARDERGMAEDFCFERCLFVCLFLFLLEI